jgi:hypothetical protein
MHRRDVARTLAELNSSESSNSALNALLGPKHTAMRVSADGLLGRLRDGKKADRLNRWMLGELLKHMQELGRRYYAGDVKAADEFLQLYCCDDSRP